MLYSIFYTKGNPIKLIIRLEPMIYKMNLSDLLIDIIKIRSNNY